jgi:hypothetical protein
MLIIVSCCIVMSISRLKMCDTPAVMHLVLACHLVLF